METCYLAGIRRHTYQSGPKVASLAAEIACSQRWGNVDFATLPILCCQMVVSYSVYTIVVNKNDFSAFYGYFPKQALGT